MPLDMMFSYLLVFYRVTIAFVFLISSVGKVRDLKQFRRTIAVFNILGSRYHNGAALLVISSEVVVVFCMVWGRQLLVPGFFLAILLLLLFCIVFLSVLMRKMTVSCNCFGPSDKPVTGFDIIRNGGLILCALTGNLLLFRAKPTSYSLTIPEWVMVGLSAAVFALIWIKLGDIIQILSQES